MDVTKIIQASARTLNQHTHYRKASRAQRMALRLAIQEIVGENDTLRYLIVQQLLDLPSPVTTTANLTAGQISSILNMLNGPYRSDLTDYITQQLGGN